MKKTVIAVAVMSVILTACGGGGSGKSAQNPLQEKNLVCQQFAPLNDLYITPVLKFSGINSNFENANDIVEVVNIRKFDNAVKSQLGIALDTADNQLKLTVLNSIYAWASAKALEENRFCYSRKVGMWDNSCTQWITPLGDEPSALKDDGFTYTFIQSMKSSYAMIRAWAKENHPDKDQEIIKWFSFFDDTYPVPTRVFLGLGMGYYFPQILTDIQNGDTQSASNFATDMLVGVKSLLNEDGSIVNRTTRGDRALWYHFISINEVVQAIYLARELGVEIDPSTEERLHKAVELFINTLNDPKYILPWASVGYENGKDGTNQEFYFGKPNDFTGWYDSQIGGAWLYIYKNWYPNHPNTVNLKNLVPYANALSGTLDLDNITSPAACVTE